MALSIPAMTWLKQASLLLVLAGVAIAGLAIAFWPRGKQEGRGLSAWPRRFGNKERHARRPKCRRGDPDTPPSLFSSVQPPQEEDLMAEFPVNPNRFDPYKNFKFRLKWDGIYIAGFRRSARSSARLKSSSFATAATLRGRANRRAAPNMTRSRSSAA